MIRHFATEGGESERQVERVRGRPKTEIGGFTGTVIKAAERTTSITTILIGAAATAGVIFFAIRALFPSRAITDAVKMISQNSEVMRILGTNIQQDTSGGENVEDVTEDDGTRVDRYNFIVRGSRGTARCWCAINKKTGERHYLLLELGDYTLYLEDHRNELPPIPIPPKKGK
eukprot:g34930.t1